ncbi:MAG: PaaI family thioesterase [Burkholderiales bacterium]|nr:PaaI family thioesterase [Burkholderiales bacterium]
MQAPAAKHDVPGAEFWRPLPFAEHLGIRPIEITEAHAVVELRRRPELLNSWGAPHGGVIMTMLDVVMSMAVRGHYQANTVVITIDMSVGFMNASRSDVVRAEGRVLHAGESTAFCEGEARDESGLLLTKAIGTFKRIAERKP